MVIRVTGLCGAHVRLRAPEEGAVVGHLGRRCSVLVLALAAFAFSGCDQAGITVRIPDFESAQVLGLWVWRWDGALQTYLPHADVVFHEPQGKGSEETMVYEVPGPELGSHVRLKTPVARTPGKTDEVTLQLLIPRGAGGKFKVSTFNEAGFSSPSREVVRF